MQREIVCAPNRKVGEFSRISIFLAGGIKNCPNWQEDIIQKINYPVVIYNPRREIYEEDNLNMLGRQIEWEKEHLKLSNIIIFWFPSDSICPTSLFELGLLLNSEDKKLFIGFDPKYERKDAMLFQVGQYRPDLKVYNSMDDLIEDLNKYLGQQGNMAKCTICNDDIISNHDVPLCSKHKCECVNISPWSWAIRCSLCDTNVVCKSCYSILDDMTVCRECLDLISKYMRYR